ncbi:uncharacterized protein LOC123443448 isoform X2 [Hordeum vulgare subsp. vulgare]|uniref:uncharacterized protein LOC123443448 isoform X2 n=1 Tax=Hordeum vulgare subsp. vulgare TaxID=112509 RepID=UPI001D1A4C28|nr:uncharacterized protein LOC123443448 isoform X2 [Hordeum vulgare subsp. vulgare]
MLVRRNTFASCPAFHPFVIVALLAFVYIHTPATAIVAVPSSHCYTFDSDSHLVDFTYLAGKNFEYNEEGSVTSDLVVQLCKDVQRRSQAGFIDFGRFINHRSFQTGSKPIDYIQRFHNGDLAKCETTFEEMGRTAQVNIICGRCSTKVCKDEHGCICSVSYDERICSRCSSSSCCRSPSTLDGIPSAAVFSRRSPDRGRSRRLPPRFSRRSPDRGGSLPCLERLPPDQDRGGFLSTARSRRLLPVRQIDFLPIQSRDRVSRVPSGGAVSLHRIEAAPGSHREELSPLDWIEAAPGSHRKELSSLQPPHQIEARLLLTIRLGSASCCSNRQPPPQSRPDLDWIRLATADS